MDVRKGGLKQMNEKTKEQIEEAKELLREIYEQETRNTRMVKVKLE